MWTDHPSLCQQSGFSPAQQKWGCQRRLISHWGCSTQNCSSMINHICQKLTGNSTAWLVKQDIMDCNPGTSLLLLACYRIAPTVAFISSTLAAAAHEAPWWQSTTPASRTPFREMGWLTLLSCNRFWTEFLSVCKTPKIYDHFNGNMSKMSHRIMNLYMVVII